MASSSLLSASIPNVQHWGVAANPHIVSLYTGQMILAFYDAVSDVVP